MSTEPATEMPPSEYLRNADKELAAGNRRKAAALLWKATEATFLRLAKERGLSRNDLVKLNADRKPPIDYSDHLERIEREWQLDLSLPFGVFMALAKTLETADSRPRLDYSGYLITASLLYAHAVTEALEDYELEGAYQETRRFIVERHGEPV